MSERLTPEILEKFQEVRIDPVKTKIRNKRLVKYAKAIGTTQEKYLDKEDPVEHPSYVGTIVVKALLGLADVAIEGPDGEEIKLILNPLYVVHAGQDYEFTDVHLKDGEKLLTNGKLDEVFIKDGMLFLVANCETTNENDEIVLKTRITAICRQGGF